MPTWTEDPWCQPDLVKNLLSAKFWAQHRWLRRSSVTTPTSGRSARPVIGFRLAILYKLSSNHCSWTNMPILSLLLAPTNPGSVLKITCKEEMTILKTCWQKSTRNDNLGSASTSSIPTALAWKKSETTWALCKVLLPWKFSTDLCKSLISLAKELTNP